MFWWSMSGELSWLAPGEVRAQWMLSVEKEESPWERPWPGKKWGRSSLTIVDDKLVMITSSGKNYRVHVYSLVMINH